VEIFVYSDVVRPDDVTRRLEKHAEHWCPIVGLSDEEVSARIRADRIDILVDLAGHTAGNRLLVFARKPAPVQLTWLGYPDTTGLAAMDYRITDEWADPPGETDRFHSEELVRLSRGFCCYLPPAEAPEVGPLPALAAGRVTFGSLNNLLKVSELSVAAWAAILTRLPEARLLIKARPLAEESARRRLIERFAHHGVSAERLELLAYVPTVRSHLEAYARVDLALDTFPYHGTTTTCEALWMESAGPVGPGRIHRRLSHRVCGSGGGPRPGPGELVPPASGASGKDGRFPAAGLARVHTRTGSRLSPDVAAVVRGASAPARE